MDFFIGQTLGLDQHQKELMSKLSLQNMVTCSSPFPCRFFYHFKLHFKLDKDLFWSFSLLFSLSVESHSWQKYMIQIKEVNNDENKARKYNV